MGKGERRRSTRRDVLQTFHVFLVIQTKGARKIYLRDVSEGGLGIVSDPADSFTQGEILPCEFHINPTLKLPLKIKIVRVVEGTVGCELTDTASKSYKAYATFIAFLDQLSEFLD